MGFNTQYGQLIFTLSSLNRSQTLIGISERIHWAFVQKRPAVSAAEQRQM